MGKTELRFNQNPHD
jgi:hypothetical protein